VTLRRRLRHALRGRALILLTDLDGTLAPLVDRPQDSRLPPGTRRSLARLARHPRARVGIVSGRGLRDLRSVVGIPGAAYAGCHGLEVAWGKARFRHPAAARLAPLLRQISRELARRTSRLRGVWVEPKGLALALHYRGADGAAQRALRALARDLTARGPGLEVRPGKKVLEVRPRVAWGKGEAVRLLRQLLRASLRRRAPVILYLGDDASDEEAFRALRGGAFCVAVGGRPSRAPYRLRGPEAVGRLLAWLDGTLAGPGGVRR